MYKYLHIVGSMQVIVKGALTNRFLSRLRDCHIKAGNLEVDEWMLIAERQSVSLIIVQQGLESELVYVM